MSAYDLAYKKMAEQGGAGKGIDPSRHISPAVAHELNNLLTVVQGYADRLLLQQGDDLDLQPHLKSISEASRRAAMIVREATPRNGSVIPGAAKSQVAVQQAA